MRQEATRGGYTLVEIMIVVAVIGLLAAMSIPAFQKARQKSQAEISPVNLLHRFARHFFEVRV